MSKYQTELPIVKFDENGFAHSDGWVQVYCASEYTREYLGTRIERTMAGFSLSAGAYTDAPTLPESRHYAVCRTHDGTEWEHVPDHRGQMAYHTQSRQRMEITAIGKLPPELTQSPPQTSFDFWNGKKWITDTTAQRQHEIQQAEIQCQSLSREAEQQITLLERKNRLGILTETEVTLLREWEIYSVKLADIDCYASNIDWPEQPK
ncbi:tail fiber protein of a prophage [Xenorhabdus vietnamensis]|uniref:Tail fiber protein of a prophage n=1 Tax=Xenorhabdus vietnamensis TaxID=351656 RepID=A0A1Y2SHU2_9GAMM|nr:tail fiber assembly protein [Xenorhabdus vietnamensis]OTA17568.1 tail fiber protein of a prophage [Xenorhabdus vietnamensis]